MLVKYRGQVYTFDRMRFRQHDNHSETNRAVYFKIGKLWDRPKK